MMKKWCGDLSDEIEVNKLPSNTQNSPTLVISTSVSMAPNKATVAGGINRNAKRSHHVRTKFLQLKIRLDVPSYDN